MDTIYALSSGPPPAAIAVVRVSGPEAMATAEALAGSLPGPREARLATLRRDGEVIDKAIVIAFPKPRSQTGEDVVEFHLHGGRAVVGALSAALEALGARLAGPGEFTRRAFDNGKIDLTGVEGLADLVQAETQAQRRAALALAEGQLSRRIGEWQESLLLLSAQVEAVLDMSDESEVGEGLPDAWQGRLAALADSLEEALAMPSAERLRDGLRVVIAGPPNSGKSSLLNALTGRDAAIVTPVAGTTRDVIEAPVAIAGLPFLLADTAGIRDSDDAVEAIGVERAQARIAAADLLLWLGDPGSQPGAGEVLLVQSKSDTRPDRSGDVDFHVSAVTGEGLEGLTAAMAARGQALFPPEGEAALNARHRALLAQCHAALAEAQASDDPLIIAESLRNGLRALDRVTGRAGVEDMLDRLFAALCIGK